MYALLFVSMDLSLGKIDKSSFSQQTLMELLIDKLENPERIIQSGNSKKVISKWPGLTINQQHEVTHINWSHYYRLKGSISLEWLPETIRMVDASSNTLDGTMSTRNLPMALRTLNVSNNMLYGSLDLTDLPTELVLFNVHDNSFSGCIDLTRLPESMQTLQASFNELSGTLDLTKLPSSMTTLFLSRNNFHGETDFSKLPEKLHELGIRNNENLSGTLDMVERKDFRVENTKVEIASKILFKN